MRAETTECDFINLTDLISTVKKCYPSLTVKRKKENYLVKIRDRRVHQWLADNRDELILLLSGLLSGYEIANSNVFSNE